MDRYTKAFVTASLAYFVAGSVVGLWMGLGTAPDWTWFAHIHFNLLGFMAMMIYGVGYFILPRFNARPLIWPAGVAVHFYLANIGLLGLVAAAPGRPSSLFLFFAGLSLLSIALFAGNLGATVLVPLREDPGVKEEPPLRITPEMRIGEIIVRWPATVDIFVKNGFAPLADPGHQEKVRHLPVTLAMGCANHNVDLARMVSLLNDSIAKVPAGVPGEAGVSSPGPIGPGDIIGDILREHPATEEVFRRYYGEACFSCPGQATETVRQSALMHNVDEADLLGELNETLQGAP